MAEKFRAFYERQIAFLENKDYLTLVESHYADDAQLVNPDNPKVFTGHAELKEFFKGYLEHLGYLKVLSTEKYVEGDDALQFEATVETAGGIARVYDIFVFKGDRIWRHFGGLLGFTPKGA
jgi:ketosteroid isomerase-like protein